MQDFKNILAWQKSHALVKQIYFHTRSFPAEEKYGIISQIRRAAVSINCNIAEGSAKATDRDFARYVQISLGSAAETEYLLLLSFELQYLSEPHYTRMQAQLREIMKMLTSLVKKLRNSKWASIGS